MCFRSAWATTQGVSGYFRLQRKIFDQKNIYELNTCVLHEIMQANIINNHFIICIKMSRSIVFNVNNKTNYYPDLITSLSLCVYVWMYICVYVYISMYIERINYHI